jgi:Holliday junction DNA helicase RuvA
MIARLRGEVVEVAADRLTIDVGGVGYEVLVAGRTAVGARIGATATLRVHTAVREDAITLYGFETAGEKSAFEQLITVQGIGPRLALGALGTLNPGELARAVEANDLRTLTAIPGVGRKTAERIALELKGKLGFHDDGPAPRPANVAAVAEDPLPLALAQLGYKRAEIDSVVARLADGGLAEAPTEQRLAAALRLFAAGPLRDPGAR